MSYRPYLSVVVTARNDDHGGNLLGRMQAFLNGWFAQVKRHRLPSELIVVDWNPPADRPPLMDALQWPAETGPCDVRFIQVPADIHNCYRHAEALPLYQMIAKNVAIRRARGRFILATNIDIIFSDELMRFLGDRGLQMGRMYRMDRHDAMPDVPIDGIDEQLEYCRTHLLRVCSREGYFELSPEGLRIPMEDDIVDRGAGIFLGSGWYAPERSAGEKFRWVDNEAQLSVIAPFDPPPSLVLEIEPGPGVGGQPCLLQVRDQNGLLLRQATVTRRSTLNLSLPAEPGAVRAFTLSVPNGGVPVTGDPRIMNCRVFRCEWGHATQPPEQPSAALNAPSSAADYEVRACSPPAAGNPLRTLSSFERSLHFYRDCDSGPVGLLRGLMLRRSRNRLFVRRAGPGQDVYAAGSRIRPGLGWEPVEYFRHETFRWVANRAELKICVPPRPRRSLALQIEPGPGVGSKAFELELRDEDGELLAAAFIERLRYIEIPLSLSPSQTQVLSLSARNGGLPCVNGDPRILDFRLFWCGWADDGADPESDLPTEPIPVASGIELGLGWRQTRGGASGNTCWTGRSGSEIILHAPDPRVKGLALTMAPTEGSGPQDLILADFKGRPLASAVIDGRQEVRLRFPLELGRSRVLRLYVGEVASSQASFHVYGWSWLLENPAATRPQLCETNAPLAQSPAEPPFAAFLHTNTCGDFTLMAREHWFDLRGYPEFDMYSFHIDSVLCYAAHHGGAREELLREPLRCYHIEHGLGSGWTPEGESKLFGRLRSRGIPWMEYSDLVRWIDDMRRFESTIIFNRENWGLAEHDLPQRTLPASTPLS